MLGRMPEAKSFIYGLADEDITAKIEGLKASQMPVLMGIVPSVDSTSPNLDTQKHRERFIFFLLKQMTNMSVAEMDVAMENIQRGIVRIEQGMPELYETVREFRNVVPNSFHYDPEFGEWNCFGYSVSFIVED